MKTSSLSEYTSPMVLQRQWVVSADIQAMAREDGGAHLIYHLTTVATEIRDVEIGFSAHSKEKNSY